MNIKINGYRLKRFYLLLLVLATAVTGCSSTPPPESVTTEPSRTDLYNGVPLIAINQSDAPTNEAQALEQATQAHRLQQLDKALYAYIQALEFNPANANTLYHIAQINAAKGEHRLAFKAYTEALEIDPEMISAHSEIGVLAMSQRQHELAKTHLLKAVELDQFRLGNTALMLNNLKFNDLDKDSPLRAYNAIAVLEDLNSNHLQARHYFRLALKYQPRSALLATNLGYSLYLSNHYNQAEKFLKQAIEYAPKFERAWTNLGLVYAKKGLYNRAISTFEQVMPSAEAYNDLGYILMLDQQYAKAIELFRSAIDVSPSYFEQANKNLKRASLSLQHQANLKE